MKIVISCSTKYRDLIKEAVIRFEKIGVTPLFPNLDYDSKSGNHADISMYEIKRLAEEHYKAINECDLFYLITPNGYVGTSCKLELGYAIAKNKPIFFSEPTNDISLDCYSKEFISTDSLEKFLKL